MRQPIHVKPHHVIDIVCKIGAGREPLEAHPYGHAVHLLAAEVLANQDAVLEMEIGADDICEPCIHNIAGVCDDTIDLSYRPAAPPRKQEWNAMIDRRWLERLHLIPGDRLTVRQFCQHLRDRAGDITEVYRELPTRMVAEKERSLRAGIKRLLAG